MGEKSTLFQSKYEVKYTPALQGFREVKLYLSENCANLVPEWTVLDLNTVLSDRPFVALLANYGDISYLDLWKGGSSAILYLNRNLKQRLRKRLVRWPGINFSPTRQCLTVANFALYLRRGTLNSLLEEYRKKLPY